MPGAKTWRLETDHHALAGTRGSSNHTKELRLIPLGNGKFELEIAIV